MTTSIIRNRIKGHRRIRAGDLVPHEWNYRTHPDMQRAALLALYHEVGFARSLLAYELPDGRLKLLVSEGESIPGAMLQIDSHYLTGIALLVANPNCAGVSVNCWRRNNCTPEMMTRS